MAARRWYILLIASLFICHLHAAIDDICTSNECSYDFTVRRVMSMTHRPPGSSQLYNVILNDTVLQHAENSFTPKDLPPHKDVVGTSVDPDDVITLDGNPRNVIIINDQFPGPTIEVMEDAQVRNLHPLEVSENYSGLTKWRSTILKSWCA